MTLFLGWELLATCMSGMLMDLMDFDHFSLLQCISADVFLIVASSIFNDFTGLRILNFSTCTVITSFDGDIMYTNRGHIYIQGDAHYISKLSVRTL